MIDVDRLKTSVDLLALAGRDTTLRRVAGTGGGEYAGPCPFCGGRDRFRVQPHAPEGGRWLCRGCTEGRWADALAYVARRESLDLRSGPDFRRACELLGATDSLPARPRPPAPCLEPPRSGLPPAEWQAKAQSVIAECERNLWGAGGERARAWLQARGLSDDTLRRWRIGYNPGAGKGQEIAGLFVPFGVVIPCETCGGVIWYLKVRRATGEPKYLHVKGGRPALFGAETLRGHDVAVICEGEFDALLLWQECRDLAGMATLGSATGRLDLAAWGAYLLPVARLLVAYDLDGAGRDGAQQLAAMTARARRVSVPAMPGVKDLTDFHTAGGKLRDWLTFELARLDLPPARITRFAGGAPGAQPAHSAHSARADWPGDDYTGPALWTSKDFDYHVTITGFAAVQDGVRWFWITGAGGGKTGVPESQLRPAPADTTGLPICQQPAEVEEAWWARVFAERGVPDPAYGAHDMGRNPGGPDGEQSWPPEADYWQFVMGNEAEALALSAHGEHPA